MHIGIVVPGFSSSETDWCIPTLLSLVRRLTESHRVTVFALRYPHRTARYQVYGARVHALGGAQARGFRKLPLLQRAVTVIENVHRCEPFDVLHAFWADEPGFVAVRAARRAGIRSIVTLLGGELVSLDAIDYGGQRSRLNRILARHALREATYVTAGSTYLAELASKLVRPELVPIGIDTERFSPELENRHRGGTTLIHVGSLVPVKDQETLLRAFAEVRRTVPDAVLHVIGSGPLENALRRLACGLELNGSVRFHGTVPHHELPPLYRSADLAVMSSLHEGQSWVTQEAGACGVTTVGTRVGVIPDLEPATLSVPTGDVRALAHAVASALSDRARLRARGALARRKVVARYSVSSTVKELESLYPDRGSV